MKIIDIPGGNNEKEINKAVNIFYFYNNRF